MNISSVYSLPAVWAFLPAAGKQTDNAAMKIWRALLVMLALLPVTSTLAQAETGVVLLHGKWGTPAGPTQALELALRGAGYRVIARDMPWSNTRAYDGSVDDSMREIDAQVAELKAGGASRIVVAGQSLGANMALAYGARHPDLDGLIALAPGHTPERMVRNPRIEESLKKAQTLVAEGKGNTFANFNDLNKGRERQVSAKPSVYLSFFDPEGEAVMPRNAAQLSPHTALLWIVGTTDPLYREGTSYGFDKAPKNPLSAYRTVEADHFGTPSAARQIVVDWLKGLR